MATTAQQIIINTLTALGWVLSFTRTRSVLVRATQATAAGQAVLSARFGGRAGPDVD